jgi:tetratricopeptide (TPR) repeat protein
MTGWRPKREDREMRRLVVRLAPLLVALILYGWGPVKAGGPDDLSRLLIKSYDLMEAGKYDQAQKIYQEVLKLDPGNPLALNNLGAIMVKKEKYPEALGYLEEALTRAKGYQVMVNRVCDVEGLCLAFRPMLAVYGNQELEPLVKMNLKLIKAKLEADKKKG